MKFIETLRALFFEHHDKSPGYRTFQGVFLPSILSIFGVIMYLRLGWLLGNVGIAPMILIILLASSITFITGLSISATATNMNVGSGGAYFMISRSLGIEIGSSIGIPLFLAQAIGIAFYIEGFSESIKMLLPGFDLHLIEMGTLIVVTSLAYFSTSLAMKAQLYIFILIILSLISIFWGGQPMNVETAGVAAAEHLPFWAAFAIFFPAVTGIEAGFSMSGDLKNARKSLPLGTLSAVILGSAVYIILTIFLWKTVPNEILRTDSMILQNIARFGFLVILGIWGATLSSAIGGILGAPRTLQALAKDGILPKFIGTGYGKNNEPRTATCITFIIAAISSYFGNIDVIAPILSMFFLISYGMLNLASGLEGMLGNPSWRPTFNTSWTLSIAGALLCIIAMFMVDPGASFVAFLIIGALYFIMSKKKMSRSWDDIRQGTLLFFSRFAIYRLANLGPSTRSWRPYFLIFAGSPLKKPFIIDFASSITKRKGFLTISTILSSEIVDDEKARRLKESVKDFLFKRHVQSLIEVDISADPFEGIKKMISSYGVGPITPNTIIIGGTTREDHFTSCADLVKFSIKKGKNFIVLQENEQHNVEKEERRIDIWWDEESRKNSELMIVLAHMLQNSPEWRDHELCIKCTVPNESARLKRMEFFQGFLLKSRLNIDCKVLVIPEGTETDYSTITSFSSNSGCVFVGLPAPNEDDYSPIYEAQLKSLKDLPMVAHVLCSEPIELEKIFY